MTAKDFYKQLFVSIGHRSDIVSKRYALKYKKGDYDFFRIASKEIKPTDKIIFISVGIHGDEIAGPFTILFHGNGIIDYIHRAGLKFIMYPLCNPSGFEIGTRYNIDGDKGTVGNEDFVIYELKDGTIVDDLVKRKNFKSWYWSSDKRFSLHLPKETKLMHKLLKQEPLPQIIAAFGLHQDYITPNVFAAAYHYSFGNLSVYKDIIKRIGKLVPVLKNKDMSAGQQSAMKSDKNGFIVRHDGSLTDIFYRLGTKYSITVETTGKTPLAIAQKINLIWIFGVVDIIGNYDKINL